MAPGLVVVSLSAYGDAGPWATRRGFDSLVQTSTGFNHAEGVAAGIDGPAIGQLVHDGAIVLGELTGIDDLPRGVGVLGGQSLGEALAFDQLMQVCSDIQERVNQAAKP